MLENRVLKFLLSLMLFVSTVLSVVPALLILIFDLDLQWFQWGILLTALVLTLPLYIYRLRMSKSKKAYIFYSALSSITIICIVSISYTLIFNEFRSRFQNTPNLLAFTIIPFYILMSLKYKLLNKINSKVATCGVAVIGALTAAIGAVFVIAVNAHEDEPEEDFKFPVDDSPDGKVGWNGGAKYFDNVDDD